MYHRRKVSRAIIKADMSPVFKKGNHRVKTKYRPVSILLSLSNIYQKAITKQIKRQNMHYQYFRPFFGTNIALRILDKP